VYALYIDEHPVHMIRVIIPGHARATRLIDTPGERGCILVTDSDMALCNAAVFADIVHD
jgi:hypothetical protein